MVEAPVQLGTSNIRIPPMGTGAWEWGDRFMWGFGRQYGAREVEETFHASLAAGIDFFDTAELYGNGRSEKFLGALMRSTDRKVIVATKFLPFPWRLTRGTLHAALRASLKRLGRESVELYQIHQPMPPNPPEVWAEALAEAAQRGLIRAAGVSNYNAEWTRRAHATLARHGMPLASNQVEYSLLDRHIEHDGTLEVCQELGVTIIAYSPLRKGILGGKYTPENPPAGPRGAMYGASYLRRVEPLLALLREIGAAHSGKTPAQVSLNWLICKGAVPIPGAKSATQVEDNAGALGWRLTPAEVARLDEVSAPLAAV
jgi:aryl-alcohol dehydrogenase-like predicted oxidoreductase